MLPAKMANIQKNTQDTNLSSHNQCELAIMGRCSCSRAQQATGGAKKPRRKYFMTTYSGSRDHNICIHVTVLHSKITSCHVSIWLSSDVKDTLKLHTEVVYPLEDGSPIPLLTGLDVK